MNALEKLAEISTSIRSEAVEASRITEKFGEGAAEQLLPLLELRNGLYAFEQALHVFSDFGAADEKGIFEWNGDALWRREYDGLAGQAVFFAEDIFGTQFCGLDQAVATFDPETGAFEQIAEDVEGWAETILKDYNLWTGYKLAHTWQMANGRIPAGSRLVPITPFVLGGKYTIKPALGRCRQGHEVSRLNRSSDSRLAGWDSDQTSGN